MTVVRYLLVILMMIALPSALYAVGMGGMGGGMGMGMGKIVDKVEIETKTVGKVVFRHSIHGTHCNDCHTKIFQKKANSNHVSMKAMERGKSCGACHNGRRAFSVKGDCVTCHAGDMVFKDKNTGNVTFSHEIHNGVSGCDDCHPDLFVAKQGTSKATMDEMAEGASCGACHDGSGAFSIEECASCHAGDMLFKEESTGNVTFSHEVHIGMFGCDECHPDLFVPKQGVNKATMDEMTEGASCGACHDGSSAFSVEDCESCHAM